MASTRTLAIIIGRAGSKGLPGKNMLPIAGKPCAQWTIEHAMASSRVTNVAVSSDSPQMLALASALGAEPIERPDELASDTATVDDASRDALARWESAHSARAERVVVLYANVPVRPPALIDNALAQLESSGCHSVQSYAPVGKYHPWWTAVVDDESGTVRPWEGDTLNHGVFRRQDLPPAHIPDGGVIALTRAALLLEIHGAPRGPHAFFGVDRRGIVSPEGSVIDIDTPADLTVAEITLRDRLRAERAR